MRRHDSEKKFVQFGHLALQYNKKVLMVCFSEYQEEDADTVDYTLMMSQAWVFFFLFHQYRNFFK